MTVDTTTKEASALGVCQSDYYRLVQDGTPSSQQQDLEMDEPAYKDEDDAQSLIQPAISPVATRLASINTSAAEKAAAIGTAEYFDPPNSPLDEPHSGEYEDANSPEMVDPLPPFATPWSDKNGCQRIANPNSIAALQPGQKRKQQEAVLPLTGDLVTKRVVGGQKASTRTGTSLQGVLGGARQRSMSAGTDALKRIQRALPSISIPSNFLPSFNTPSFLVLSPPIARVHGQGQGQGQGEQSPTVAAPNGEAKSRGRMTAILPTRAFGLQQDMIPEETEARILLNTSRPRPESVSSSKCLVIRHSTSDDSLLYHTLSRVSSLGDDDKFANVSAQVNARFKAIVDSLPDRPTFKLPQMPNIVSSPLKRFQTTASGQSQTNTSTPSTTSLNGNALDRVLETLQGDVVILGGYRGSVLRSAQPPNRQLWVPVKVGLNMRRVNLALPLDDSADERAEETVIGSGMLQNIGPIDISRRLFKKLRDSDNCKNGTLRVWDYGYDWRLSPHVLSRKLQQFLQALPSNQPDAVLAGGEGGAVVIAHSLGGIITRHAVNARPELFAGVVYAGTPTRCINILGPLRNGDSVLLNEKALTAAVNFSLRTSFVFLPEDGKCFVDRETGEELDVDFYDAQAWADNNLSPVVGGAGTGLSLSTPPPTPTPKEEPNSPASPFGSFINLSGSLAGGLPRLGRKDSEPPKTRKRTMGEITSVAVATTAATAAAAVGAPQLCSTTNGIVGGGRNTADNKDIRGTSNECELSYLARTLAATKQFRLETQYQPSLGAANAYPPIAMLYGRGTPTVYRARVSGREAIATAEAYADLMFREGDGVVLSREAVPPPGYGLVRGGKVSSSKGHLGLLGDLGGVGAVLEAIVTGRRKGIGLGCGALRSSNRSGPSLGAGAAGT